MNLLQTFSVLIYVYCALVYTSLGSAREVLNHWFALGSGCRAKHDLLGDVHMRQEATGKTGLYKAVFTFDKLALSSDKPSLKNPLHFGKECAVRLHINPPAGKKIKRLIATTKLALSKSVESDLLVNGELRLGGDTLDYVRAISKQGEALSEKRIEVALDSSRMDRSETIRNLKCGQPKIIGFDYTFIIKRTSDKSPVSVELIGRRELEISAELESC